MIALLILNFSKVLVKIYKNQNYCTQNPFFLNHKKNSMIT
ncbi:hypothetical protein EV142_107226 [Flavobacterium circumlabens]|uniref:Uncharacterized protein n=1 Tax=Flavobacterium circumlabens TaxID=2133765 RepID=A0ABY2AVZ9_9FLAO|nr:hypothetical protein EV142_107226 [Flavobacterium circumlabens]